MDFLTEFSLVTLLLIAGIVLLTLWFAGPGYNTYSISQSPTILTSMGIFGTFLGVAIGLYEFDTSRIQASVPALIEGLKTAFWTSIVGLVGALSVKFRHLLVLVRQSRKQEDYRTASITDLANILSDIHNVLSDPNREGLLRSMAGFHEEIQHDMREIKNCLDHYQTHMAEANSKALVTAINAVMRDFNTEINAQYGENFRQLNEAVGQMLAWQKSYKAELESLLESQKINSQLLDKASQAYKEVVEHSEIFTHVSSSLGVMLSALQTQSEQLDQYLDKLSQVAEKAASGLPFLEKRVDNLTESFSNSLLQGQSDLNSLLLESAQSLCQASENMNQRLSEVIMTSQSHLTQQLEQMVARTDQQLIKLDDALENELTHSLRTFGYQLTALSEKFVADYLPLTEKLQDLVRLSAEADTTHEPSKHTLPAQTGSTHTSVSVIND